MHDDSCACPEAGKWKIDDSLSGYAGEVVLVCSYCGLRYYNAQEFFPKEELDAIEHIKQPLRPAKPARERRER